jgi:hypothetical protein
MASQDNLLSKIAALVAAFDDASWEALASKGLLRRARKDLEKGTSVEVAAQTANGVEIKVPPYLVFIPVSGPARGTCSCPAPGICHHILMAGLYLQKQTLAPTVNAISSNSDSIRDEISFFTPERLKSWAGASDYRAGVSLLEKNTAAPVIEYGDTLTVRLMPSGIEARYVPAAGLDGMILPKVNAKRTAVAAILSLRTSLGLEVPEAGLQQSLIEVTGTPRTQKEILTSACTVLEDAVKVGLSHASPIVVERLATLAVSAQGVSLPRVSLALKTVGDEVTSILQREARADEARLLLMMARVYALMEAIRLGVEKPRIELAGAHRAQYVDVPEIDLSGLGAYTWKTGSGFTGLTVVFWSSRSKEFLSWSEARPGTQQFDPRQRFYADGPWDGVQSPRQAASSNLKLRNARRTVGGRLSSSTKTSALVLAPTDPQTLEFGGKLFSSWETLHRYSLSKQPLGLREPNPLDLVVVLQPVAFGSRAFDSISQTFTWELYDEADRSLEVSLPFRDSNQDAIRVLEGLNPPQESRWCVLVRIALRDGSLTIEPISILRPEDLMHPVFQLSFDSLPQMTRPKNLSRSAEPDDEEESQEDELLTDDISMPGTTKLSHFILELNRRLQAIAETGCQNGLHSHKSWFEQLGADANNSGLISLGRVLHGIGRTPQVEPRAILQARYLSHLHSQALGQLM